LRKNFFSNNLTS